MLAKCFIYPWYTHTWTAVEFTISTPGTSNSIYSHNWQIYYLTPYPTYITLKLQARVQMRNGDTVKATATSEITFTLKTW